jgi:hypothetical protein
MMIREHIPDAAGMAVCIDQMHAVRVAQVIHNVTGCKPSIVVSDEDKATDNVEDFRKSKREWLVSVRVVSEGTDIRRLHVLCYLTNSTTEIFFRQIIGRVSRVRFQEKTAASSEDAGSIDLESFVYLPADPRLVAHAKNIEQAQLCALREQSEREHREMTDSEMAVFPQRTFLGSEHDGLELVVTFGGKEYRGNKATHLKELLALGISSEKAQKLVDNGWAPTIQNQQEREPTESTLQDRLDNYGRLCNRAANHLAKLVGCEVWDVHKQWKRQAQMNEAELKEKLTSLKNMIAGQYK